MKKHGLLSVILFTLLSLLMSAMPAMAVVQPRRLDWRFRPAEVEQRPPIWQLIIR